MKKSVILSFICLFFWLTSSVFWLSTIAEKEVIYWDLVLESSSLVYWTPEWFVPYSLSSAPEDISYWVDQVLPYAEYRNEDLYMVIPQLGLITPVVGIPAWSTDFTEMVSWWEIAINNYLNHWIIEYANSWAPWHWGKRVDFGHSNFFINGEWNFKNIFANLMRLDPGDEVWYYEKNSSWSYDQFKYKIMQSYNTSPSNVSPLLRDGDGADALIFGCTHWLDGRWMIEAEYMWDPIGEPYDPYENLNLNYKWKIDDAVEKISWLRENRRKYTIIQLVKLINKIREVHDMNSVPNVEYKDLDGHELILQYLEDMLVWLY